nr:MAG TPA: hypothetical protein [Caudoviricetes sp.]
MELKELGSQPLLHSFRHQSSLIQRAQPQT